MHTTRSVVILLAAVITIYLTQIQTRGQGLPIEDVRITAKHSGKVLDVFSDSLTNGARIQQFAWHEGLNQRWGLDNLNNGYFRILAKHSSKVLQIEGSAMANGIAAVQADWKDEDNQEWALTKGADGYYTITAKHSGKCLDVEGASTADQARVIQYQCNGGDNQKWTLEVLPALQLPAKVVESLNQQYPGWKQASTPPTCFAEYRNSVLSGDFDKNGSVDYVVNLTVKNKGYIVAFLSKGANYTKYTVVSSTSDEINNTGMKWVKGQSESIDIGLCESDSGCSYTFKNGGFKCIQ